MSGSSFTKYSAPLSQLRSKSAGASPITFSGATNGSALVSTTSGIRRGGGAPCCSAFLIWFDPPPYDCALRFVSRTSQRDYPPIAELSKICHILSEHRPYFRLTFSTMRSVPAAGIMLVIGIVAYVFIFILSGLEPIADPSATRCVDADSITRG